MKHKAAEESISRVHGAVIVHKLVAVRSRLRGNSAGAVTAAKVFLPARHG